jgi:fimbrial chaperone protein
MAAPPSTVFAASLRFVPMSILLDAAPRRAALTIMNTGDEKVTVQLQLMKWHQDGQGKDIYEPTKDLVFYPQIVSIAAGKEGTVRVGYDNAGTLSNEMAYRLFVQELPVRKPGEKIIRIALRVGIPVFIAPSEPRPTITCEEARIVDGRFQATFRNGGNAHAMIQKISVTGIDASGTEIFSKELAGWYVLPGVSRPFAVEVAPEECRAAKVMRIQGTAGDVIAKGQYDVDTAACAQLVATGAPGKLDVEKLMPPAAH